MESKKFITNVTTSLGRTVKFLFTIEGSTIVNINCKARFKDNESIAELVIPSTFSDNDNTYNIDTIGPSVFAPNYLLSLKAGISLLKIDDNITKIVASAFRHTNIKEVIWPKLCPIIPDNCFAESTLEKIHNIDNIIRVENMAFIKTSLQEFNWPETCISVPDSCFSFCYNLKSINIPDTVETIGKQAFWECKSIFSFSVPKNCCKISESCFSSCTSLESIVFNSSHIEIEDKAFLGTPLKSVDVSGMMYFDAPDSVFPTECKVKLPFYN